MSVTFMLQAYSQKKVEISGRVVDSHSNPAAGITIFIDKTNTGKITDRNGNFRLKVGTDAMVISILTPSGEFLEAPINRQEENIIIVDGGKLPGGSAGSEEKINIGYGSVERKNLTEPVNKLDVEKRNVVFSSIYEMIGTQPGVQVNGRKILIRGVSSFTSDTQPLFVLDGNVVSDIDNISPESVKSIEILKGSSTSIYGSRGANGVILITLKK